MAREYISGSNATGLGLPWRYAASLGQFNFLNDTGSTQVGLPFVWVGTQASLQQTPFINRPVLTRFAEVATGGSMAQLTCHIKTLFLTKPAKGFGTVHEVRFHTHTGFPHARTVATTGETVPGPWLPPDCGPRPVDPVAELVHVEKSCAEHVVRRTFRGGRADLPRTNQEAVAVKEAGIRGIPKGTIGGAAVSSRSTPKVLVDAVAQVRTILETKWPRCVADSIASDPVPMTALRDLWLAELDAKYQATARYKPLVVNPDSVSQAQAQAQAQAPSGR